MRRHCGGGRQLRGARFWRGEWCGIGVRSEELDGWEGIREVGCLMRGWGKQRGGGGSSEGMGYRRYEAETE